MQKLAAEFDRNYNQRKHRSNAFRGDNFHATLVEEGSSRIGLHQLGLYPNAALWLVPPQPN